MVDDENSISRRAILVWAEVKAVIHNRGDDPEWSLKAPALIYDAILAENEACAKVADGFTCGLCGMDGKAAAAIRARQTPTGTGESRG